MGLLSNDIDNIESEEGITDLSTAADWCIQHGVYPLNEVHLLEETTIRFSSRKPLHAAVSIAQSFIKQRYDCNSWLGNHDEYETRGYFDMVVIGA